MLISYSAAKMRPWIEAGIAEENGADVGGARVKRQTIRAITGPASPWLRLIKAPLKYRLQHWFGSPRNHGEKLGETGCLSASVIHIGNTRGVVHVAWQGEFLSDYNICKLAVADGFDTLDEFRRYFVPNPGDMHGGKRGSVLIKW